MKTRLVVCLWVLCCGQGVWAQLQRQHNFDVEHVLLDISVDFEKKSVSGSATLTLKLTESTDTLHLDAAEMRIGAVYQVVGKKRKKLPFVYIGGSSDGNLRIKLKKGEAVGRALDIVVAYESQWLNQSDPNSLGGSVGKGLRFFGPTSTDPLRRRQVYSVGEPEGNRYWFPCYDAPDDWYTSEMRVRVPDGLTAIGSGLLVNADTVQNGQRLFIWQADAPHANHLTSLVAGEYVDITQQVGDKMLHSFGYPDERDATEASVVQLGNMMRFFSEKTNMPYLFPSYAQVFVQEFPNVSSNAGTATITENMVDDFSTHDEYRYLWDLSEAEAMSQQWFGHAVGCSNWSDVWLNKAFGRYLSGLYTAHLYSEDEFVLYQHGFDHSTYLADWHSGKRQPIVTTQYPDAYTLTQSNNPYFRGASVLRMLHRQLGDDDWWMAMHHYLADNAHKPVTTHDLQLACQKASTQRLHWFFQQWVYGMGHPVFEVSEAYEEATKQLTIKVLQVQTKDTSSTFLQTEFFQGKLDISIEGKQYTLDLAAKQAQTFTFSCPTKPRWVHFDCGNTWIKELNHPQPLDALLQQFQYEPDIAGQSNAMLALAQIAKDSSTSTDQKQQIYAAFRNVITSDAYWRLRFNAIGQLQGLLAPWWQPEAANLDSTTRQMLVNIIEEDHVWVRRAAINLLGMTRDTQYVGLYSRCLRDSFDRVVNAAAIALGKTKSPAAFDLLSQLPQRPSWKNQSLMSALNGLRELGDPRGFGIAQKALQTLDQPHWTLAVTAWDYRLAAAETIAALQKGDETYPYLFAALQKAIAEKDLHGAHYTALLISTSGATEAENAAKLVQVAFDKP